MDPFDLRLRSLAPAAVVVVCVLVFGFVLSTLADFSNPQLTPVEIGGAISSSRATTLIQESASRVPGGPWTMSVVDGIASPSPPSVPPSFSCRSVQGPSVWNATQVPATIPPANLGLAAYWAGVLLNASGALLIVSVADGVPHVLGPLPPGDCEGSFPANLGNDARLIGNLADSREVANRAMDTSTFRSFVANHPDYVAIYNLGGWPLLADIPYSGASWSVQLQTCGVPGSAPVSPDVSDFFNANTGIPSPGGVLSGAFACFEPSYALDLTSSHNVSSPGLRTYEETFRISGSTFGLSTWMFGFRLTGPTGTAINTSQPNCGSLPAPLNNCTSDPGGWYGVLSFGNGSVGDVWGTVGNGTQWQFSNGLINEVFGQETEFTVVAPFALSGSGDVLTAYALTECATIGGNTTV